MDVHVSCVLCQLPSLMTVTQDTPLDVGKVDDVLQTVENKAEEL